MESLTTCQVGDVGRLQASPLRFLPPVAAAESSYSLPERIGQYTLIRELGHGGMGVVYLAEQTNLKRPVALKIIRHGVNATPEEVSRFCAEAEAVARLQHPNIVQIYEVGSQEGLYYLALEYVSGGSLDRQLAGTPQEARSAAQLIETLARAVNHAHERGILHRDLKPANVLLQISDCRLRLEREPAVFEQSAIANLQSAVPKIADFGLAKRLEAGNGHTQSGVVVGTPSYVAPEQASAKREITPAVDVYGLGALLYEMLTGHPPFKAASPLATLDMVVHQEPIAPSSLVPRIPRDLQTICLTCLHKEPARRYPTALELADDLRRFLDHDAIRARAVSPLERVWKWARRRPAVAGLSVAIVLVTLASLGLVTWQWRRAEGETVQARQAEARLALQQGLTLCERGDLSAGLLWLARALDRADGAGTAELDRPIRINLADWGSQIRPVGIRLENPGEDRSVDRIAVLGLAFSPDDRTLLAAGKDGRVHYWDLAVRRVSGPALVHDSSWGLTWVSFVDFSPDGRTIATVCHDAARLWHAATHELDGAPLPHPRGMLWGMAFFPDGRRLATSSDDGSIRVWDLSTRRVVLGPLWHAHDRGYYTVAVSGDGQTLVTAGSDGRAIRWDLGSGKPVGPPLPHDSSVLKALLTRDGRRLFTSTRGGTLHAWDLRTGRGTDLLRQGAEINGLALSPDGRSFASATNFGVVRVWDTESLRPVGPVYRHSVGVTAVAFSRDGRRLAMGTMDGGIHIVELSAARDAILPAQVGAEVHSLQYTADGDRLMAGRHDGVRWVEAATGRTLEGSLLSPYWLIQCAALSPDGRSLAMGRWAGKGGPWSGCVDWWDPVAGRRLGQTPELPAPVGVVVYSPDGRRLFACGNRPDLEGGAAMWEVASGRQLRPLLRSLGQVDVRQAAFDPSGRVLLLACSDGRARLWDTETDIEIDPDRPLLHGSAVMACAFDRGGRRVLTGCQDGAARLWDVETRRLLVEPLRQEGEVSGVAFGPDGQIMLTGSLDGTGRFWDVVSGKPLGPALGHAGGVRAVAFSRDGRRAATGGKDGAVRQWRLPPPPLAGSVERIGLWAEVLTEMKLDRQGAVHELDAHELKARRQRLEKLGGPLQLSPG
jgi:WD40 repeat protein/predicted Ser/Thr protein kinase